LLREPITVAISLAALLIFGGTILIGTTGSYKVGKHDMPEGLLAKGVLAALGTAVCWGVSPALVKIGLNEIGFPLMGTLISYMASSAIVGLLLFHRPSSDKLRHLDRSSVRSFIIVAILTSTAQMLRYLAINLSRISLVAPLIASIKPLLVIPLSFLMNRDIEFFGSRIIAGSVLVVTGFILAFVAA
jgi:drug/metabolite transporter (DMT)-like permease